MIEAIPFEDDRILAFRITGKVELSDLLPILDRLDQLLASERPLRGYVEITDFEGVSAEALLKDFRYALKHFRSLATRFERVAVVTDSAWIRSLTTLESLLIPGVEEKVFRTVERERARTWVSE
jgi:hypothetical protein